jgi:hypothetical protein
VYLDQRGRLGSLIITGNLRKDALMSSNTDVSFPRSISDAPTFYKRRDIRLTRDSFALRAIYCRVSMYVDLVVCGRFPQRENIESNAVLAGIEFRAQDLDTSCRQCPGYITAQPVSISRADG